MKNLIVASTSTLFGENYLEYLLPELELHFKDITTILFIPFARPGGISHEEYTAKVASALAKIGKKVVGLHSFENKKEAIQNAEAIFTGGGNTFLLVQQLHELDLMKVLKETLENGTPYLGCSAGSNITGISMKTTNDMPIVFTPSFDTLGVVPFNINPHYLDPDSNLKHNGETRETRIKEFHAFNAIPVLGLREGSWLQVKGNDIILKGKLTARWFTAGNEAVELAPETKLNTIV